MVLDCRLSNELQSFAEAVLLFGVNRIVAVHLPSICLLEKQNKKYQCGEIFSAFFTFVLPCSRTIESQKQHGGAAYEKSINFCPYMGSDTADISGRAASEKTAVHIS